MHTDIKLTNNYKRFKHTKTKNLVQKHFMASGQEPIYSSRGQQVTIISIDELDCFSAFTVGWATKKTSRPGMCRKPKDGSLSILKYQTF